MPNKGYKQSDEHRAKIAAMRKRSGTDGTGQRTNLRHGMTGTPTYISWSAMRQRCSPSGKYAKFGTKVCDRWNFFENFFEDMGERPENMTLDRIDVTGDYEPKNCRWATDEIQQSNRRGSR